jgi:membrane-associated phospholipid phosphatase
MKNTSYKTTIVGIFGFIILIMALALVYFEKATFTEVAAGLGFITTFLTGLLALLAKDADKTGLPK